MILYNTNQTTWILSRKMEWFPNLFFFLFFWPLSDQIISLSPLLLYLWHRPHRHALLHDIHKPSQCVFNIPRPVSPLSVSSTCLHLAPHTLISEPLTLSHMLISNPGSLPVKIPASSTLLPQAPPPVFSHRGGTVSTPYVRSSRDLGSVPFALAVRLLSQISPDTRLHPLPLCLHSPPHFSCALSVTLDGRTSSI